MLNPENGFLLKSVTITICDMAEYLGFNHGVVIEKDPDSKISSNHPQIFHDFGP